MVEKIWDMSFEEYSKLKEPVQVPGPMNAPTGFCVPSPPNEYYYRCPYEETHGAVLNSEFRNHLQECRDNFVKKVTNNGTNVEALIYVNCRFDSEHAIIPQESKYHDDVCGSRLRRLYPYRFNEDGSKIISTRRRNKDIVRANRCAHYVEYDIPKEFLSTLRNAEGGVLPEQGPENEVAEPTSDEIKKYFEH